MIKPRKGKGPFGPLPSILDVRRLAKALDTPEMRALYRRQKASNPGLDESVDKMSEKLEEIFNHEDDSNE